MPGHGLAHGQPGQAVQLVAELTELQGLEFPGLLLLARLKRDLLPESLSVRATRLTSARQLTNSTSLTSIASHLLHVDRDPAAVRLFSQSPSLVNSSCCFCHPARV